MSRREDIWSQYSNLDTDATNLFENYTTPYDYDDMSAVLKQLGIDTSNMLNRSTGNTIQRGQKDTAARLASQGITGGSVANTQIGKVATDANKSLTDALEKLGIDQQSQSANLMQTENENTYKNTQASQNVIMQNILNKMNKLNSQSSYLGNWEQQDAANDASSFNFFRDVLPGLISSGSSLGSAAISASDERVKKNIKRVDISDEGIPIVEFNYKDGDSKRYRGVLAQDVEKVIPSAVIEKDGVKYVDYSQLSVKMTEVPNE